VSPDDFEEFVFEIPPLVMILLPASG